LAGGEHAVGGHTVEEDDCAGFFDGDVDGAEEGIVHVDEGCEDARGGRGRIRYVCVWEE